MLKQFLTRKALEWRLRKTPKEQREQVLSMVKKDPDLFARIAKEIKAEMEKGKNETGAAMSVMPRYQKELRRVMGARGERQRFNPNGSIRT